MENNIIVSKKINLKKKLKVLWIVVALALVVACLVSYMMYSNYKEGQDFAVTVTLLAMNQKFDSYRNDYPTMVHEMYNEYSYYSELNRHLGNILSDAGFKRHFGKEYLEYTGYFDYTINNPTFAVAIWIVLTLLTGMIHLYYIADRKNEMILDGDTIVCKKKGAIIKQFMIKDVKSVSTSGIRGLKILGSGIKYTINLVENRDEIKNAIMDKLAVLPAQNISVTQKESSADSILKYKELLELGVISQEEFDAKKKQLMEL